MLTISPYSSPLPRMSLSVRGDSRMIGQEKPTQSLRTSGSYKVEQRTSSTFRCHLGASSRDSNPILPISGVCKPTPLTLTFSPWHLDSAVCERLASWSQLLNNPNPSRLVHTAKVSQGRFWGVLMLL
jgi:hypothetical protein